MRTINIFKLVGSLLIKDEASKTLDNFKKKADEVEGKVGSFGDKVGKFGKGMGDVGKTLSTRVTAPLVALGGIALASADNVDKAYRDIRVGTGATGEDLEALEESFRNVFKGVPDSAETVANALATLNTFTGQTEEQLESLTLSVLDASRTLGEDGVNNSELFGKALNSWNIEAEASEGHLDHMYSLTQTYGVGLGELSGLVTNHGTVLKNAGFEMDEVAHLFSSMQNKGISVTRIMPGLNKATRDWASEGKNAKEELDKVIKSMENAESETEALSIATEVFGAQGAQRMVDGVRNGAIPALDELGSMFEESSGVISETTEDTRTMGEQFQLLKNSTALALEPIGRVILDLAKEYLPPLIEAVQKVAEWFRDLSPHAQKMIVVVGGIAAAIGPVIVVIGTLVSAVGKIISFFKLLMPVVKLVGVVIGGISWPVVAVVAAIAALIAIGVALWKNWDKVKEVAGNVFGWIKDFIVNAFETVTGAISDALDWVTDNVGGTFGDVAEVVKEYLNMAWENIKLVWDFIKETFSNALDFVKALVSGDFEGMKEIIGEQLESAKELISNIWENIKEFFDGKLSEIVEGLKEKFHDMFLAIAEKLGLSEEFIAEAWEYIEGYFQDALDFLKALVSGDFEGMKEAISNAMSSAKEFLSNIWDEMKLQISNRIKEILGNVKEKFLEIKEKIMTPIREAKNKVQEFIDNIKKFFTDGSQGALDTVREKFEEIKDRIMTPIEEAKGKVEEIVDDIKGFFENMKLKIPEIGLPKLPKPKVTGGFKLDTFPPQVPKISWNAEGGIFDEPTIFNTSKGLQGVGEAGAEAIMPLDKLRSWIGEWVSAANESNNASVVSAIDRIGVELSKSKSNNSNEDDRLEELLYGILTELQSSDEKILRAMTSALNSMGIEWNDRELARMVKNFA